MLTIPLRELRDRMCEVLRRAEHGERFVITIDGSPVAELGPHRQGRWVARDRLLGLMTGPAPPTLLDDLRRLGGEIADRFAQ